MTTTKLERAKDAAIEVAADLGFDLDDTQAETLTAEILGTAGIRDAEILPTIIIKPGDADRAARERIRKNGGNHAWLQR